MAPGGLMWGMRRVLKGSKGDKSPASTTTWPSPNGDGHSSHASLTDGFSTSSEPSDKPPRQSPSAQPPELVAVGTPPMTQRSRSSTSSRAAGQSGTALLDPRAQQAALRHSAAGKGGKTASTPRERSGNGGWAKRMAAEEDSDTSLEFPDQVVEDGPPPNGTSLLASADYGLPDTEAAAVVAQKIFAPNPLFGGAPDLAAPPLSYKLSSPESLTSYTVSEGQRSGRPSSGTASSAAAKPLQIPADVSEASPNVITPAARQESRTAVSSDGWRTSPSQSQGSASSGRASRPGSGAQVALAEAASAPDAQPATASQAAEAGFSDTEAETVEDAVHELYSSSHRASPQASRALPQTPVDGAARWQPDLAASRRPPRHFSPGDRLPPETSSDYYPQPPASYSQPPSNYAPPSASYAQPPSSYAQPPANYAQPPADPYSAERRRQRLVQSQPIPSGWPPWEAERWQQPVRPSSGHESSGWPPQPPPLHLQYPSQGFEAPYREWEGPGPYHQAERDYMEAYLRRAPQQWPEPPRPSTSEGHGGWSKPPRDPGWQAPPFYAASGGYAQAPPSPHYRQQATEEWQWRRQQLEREAASAERSRAGVRPEWGELPPKGGRKLEWGTENRSPNTDATSEEGRANRRRPPSREAPDAETFNVKEEVSELRRVAAFLQSKLVGVEQELAAAREQQANSRSERSSAEDEAAELRVQLAESQAAQAELAALVEELKVGLERAVVEKDAEMSQLRECLAAARAEADHQEELADLAVGELDEFKRRLGAEVEHARAEAVRAAAIEARGTTALARQLEQAKADLDRSMEEGEALHEMLAVNHQKRAELETRTEDLQAELELCKGSLARTQQQLVASEADKAGAEARVKDLEAQLEHFSAAANSPHAAPHSSRLLKSAQAPNGKQAKGDNKFEGLMDSLDFDAFDILRSGIQTEDGREEAGADAELKRLRDVEALAVDALQALEAQTREAIRLRAHAAELEAGLQQRESRLQEALQRQAVLEDAIADRDAKVFQKGCVW